MQKFRRSQQGRGTGAKAPEGFEATYSGFYSVDYFSPDEEERQDLIEQQARQSNYLPQFREDQDITVNN